MVEFKIECDNDWNEKVVNAKDIMSEELMDLVSENIKGDLVKCINVMRDKPISEIGEATDHEIASAYFCMYLGACWNADVFRWYEKYDGEIETDMAKVMTTCRHIFQKFVTERGMEFTNRGKEQTDNVY